MPIYRISFTCAVLLSSIEGSVHAENFTTDICIYGGTSAGVVAAVQVKAMGKSVILLEPGKHLGSMSSEGLGGTDIDNHEFQNSRAVGGLALEFYRRISKAYGREEKFVEMLRNHSKQGALWKFESSVAEKIFDDWVASNGIQVIRGARLADRDSLIKDGPSIASVTTAAGDQVSAKIFIDATFEGDLLAAAGVGTAIGREGNAKYGETLNGIRTVTTHGQFDIKVDPYKNPGDPASGLIFGVQPGELGKEGDGDDSIQAYCFRVNLTKDATKLIPFAKPDNYDPSHYEIQRRYAKAGGKLGGPSPSLPNGGTDPGSWHQLAGNMPGWNHQYPAANFEERQKMIKDSLDYIKGLYWFFANDPDVPENVRDAWSKWGTSKDEFRDNGGWPRIFYVRNGRRMVSDFVLTEKHLRKENPEPVADPVAISWWPPDLHNARRIVKNGAIWNEGAVFGGDQWIPFGISYRALVPKASECTNLLTPTCPSSSYVAYGAIRLEWTFMAAAQATATAAAMAIDDRQPVQRLDYQRLLQRLKADGQITTVAAD